VRVGNNTGNISTSALLCGVDWITSTRQDDDKTNDIAVVNMSFRGSGSDDGNCGYTKKDPFHQAICASEAFGVAYIAAAGNSAGEIDNGSPAAYHEVLTATAITDFDGVPGGLGTTPLGCTTLQTSDDAPATFSDFGTTPQDEAHTVAAPGVCVLSTVPPDETVVPLAQCRRREHTPFLQARAWPLRMSRGSWPCASPVAPALG
jgi:hypothetical protein